jgi:hypothetical protein
VSTYYAIAAVSRAIVDLLEEARPSEFPEAQFSVFKTEDFRQPLQTGVSVYLYRVAAVRGSRTPSGIDPGGVRTLPALPLSLHYLLTPWSADPAWEHVLLAWAMRVLADSPMFSSALLNRVHAGAFGQNETIELTLEDLPLADALSLGRHTGDQYRLGVSYAARVVMINSSVSIDMDRRPE